MTVATAAPASTREHWPGQFPLPPLEVTWGKLMMWLFLCSDAMSFAGLLAAYAAVRIYSPSWVLPSNVFDIPLTAINTFILIISSLTMVKALSGFRHGHPKTALKFLLATALGGAMFLGIQVFEWYHLIHEGLSPAHVAMVERTIDNVKQTIAVPPLEAATFFILTGFHGCHVFGGVVILLTVSARWKRYGPTNYNGVEVAGLYWHFVDLIWILVFTFVYLL